MARTYSVKVTPTNSCVPLTCDKVGSNLSFMLFVAALNPESLESETPNPKPWSFCFCIVVELTVVCVVGLWWWVWNTCWIVVYLLKLLLKCVTYRGLVVVTYSGTLDFLRSSKPNLVITVGICHSSWNHLGCSAQYTTVRVVTVWLSAMSPECEGGTGGLTVVPCMHSDVVARSYGGSHHLRWHSLKSFESIYCWLVKFRCSRSAGRLFKSGLGQAVCLWFCPDPSQEMDDDQYSWLRSEMPWLTLSEPWVGDLTRRLGHTLSVIGLTILVRYRDGSGWIG